MRHTKQIAIILPDILQRIGLQSLLSDFFPPVEIYQYPTLGALSAAVNDQFDCYFTNSTLFILHADFFLPRQSKTIVLLEGERQEKTQTNIHYIQTQSCQESIIEQLEQFFANEATLSSSENNKELSAREIDVLQLIVKGSTNKEIADKLYISLNTVLSHRKNIMAKLGIKTVSGLTFYAIMNGLVSGDNTLE